MINIEDVKIKVKEINAIRGDNTVAHMLEDKLYIAVLQAIVDGVDNPQELAKEALKAYDLEYTRWYA